MLKADMKATRNNPNPFCILLDYHPVNNPDNLFSDHSTLAQAKKNKAENLSGERGHKLAFRDTNGYQ